ncbi:MAG: hypothetical protein IT373_04905 [Polyangiaceae bacterium]|nr:hypothetical protein [Polyangiaceae bacterium]
MIDPDEGIPRPAAEDLLSGHVLIDVGAGVVAPSSDLLPDLDGVGHPKVGAGAGLRLGVGVARSVSLDLLGGFAWLGGGDLCEDCRSYAFDAGLGVTYHVVQGIAFDPWIGYAAGYRHLLLTLPDSTERYHALDFARLGVGADFYPAPTVGLGPFIETDIGVRTGADASVYALFSAGVRVAFDPMRAGLSLAPGGTGGTGATAAR